MSNGSEVARLLAQISAEYEAAERGLNGFTYGASQHQFITARMENMQQYQAELSTVVGSETEATRLVAATLEALPDTSTSREATAGKGQTS